VLYCLKGNRVCNFIETVHGFTGFKPVYHLILTSFTKDKKSEIYCLNTFEKSGKRNLPLAGLVLLDIGP